jgi:hypothetical protein
MKAIHTAPDMRDPGERAACQFNGEMMEGMRVSRTEMVDGDGRL